MAILMIPRVLKNSLNFSLNIFRAIRLSKNTKQRYIAYGDDLFTPFNFSILELTVKNRIIGEIRDAYSFSICITNIFIWVEVRGNRRVNNISYMRVME